MRTQKQQGVKAPKGETTKVNLTLGIQTSKRLFVSAIMSGRTASSLVEELIELHLKSWSLPSDLTARAKSRQVNESAISDVHINSPSEIAA